ncbi:hypothetical protein H5410_001621 [Solanum commersonii]|uniref:Uncharacterized protein n=1 Tax=Solanum commersonii TaxID=4109 RepID=A0A9J6AZJ5_SOLCO|nr:hypothetical protein H5410_001621 [Solanum commersonii]
MYGEGSWDVMAKHFEINRWKSTGYKKLNLELSYGRRIKMTHFQLGEDELLSSSLHKTLSKLERKIL